MDKNKNAIEQLKSGIKLYVDSILKNAPMDKTYVGLITKINEDNTYSVLIKNVTYNNVPTIGGTCTMNETVKVTVPQNQFSSMFILKGGSGSGGGKVISVNGKDGVVVLDAEDVGAVPNSVTIPTVTDTYSATSSDGMSGKAVASAISDKADKSTLATVATSGSYNDLTNKPTIPTVVDVYSPNGTEATSGKAVADALANFRHVETVPTNVMDRIYTNPLVINYPGFIDDSKNTIQNSYDGHVYFNDTLITGTEFPYGNVKVNHSTMKINGMDLDFPIDNRDVSKLDILYEYDGWSAVALSPSGNNHYYSMCKTSALEKKKVVALSLHLANQVPVSIDGLTFNIKGKGYLSVKEMVMNRIIEPTVLMPAWYAYGQNRKDLFKIYDNSSQFDFGYCKGFVVFTLKKGFEIDGVYFNMSTGSYASWFGVFMSFVDSDKLTITYKE